MPPCCTKSATCVGIPCSWFIQCFIKKQSNKLHAAKYMMTGTAATGAFGQDSILKGNEALAQKNLLVSLRICSESIYGLIKVPLLRKQEPRKQNVR